MSTWDAMTPSEYADCMDAGRGEPRDVRHEADQLRKARREAGVPVFSGAGECVICRRPTVGSVHGEPVCGDCEDRMAAETRDNQ